MRSQNDDDSDYLLEHDYRLCCYHRSCWHHCCSVCRYESLPVLTALDFVVVVAFGSCPKQLDDDFAAGACDFQNHGHTADRRMSVTRLTDQEIGKWLPKRRRMRRKELLQQQHHPDEGDWGIGRCRVTD